MTRVEFGLDISASVHRQSHPVADAKRAEELGFAFVSVNDHVHGPKPRFETWTMMAWIAAQTSRIRVASRVLGLPFRHPSMLAKMAESFDRLSGGRLILGLGAGASEEEFSALGVGGASRRERIEGLAEGIRLIRGLWTEPTFTMQGLRYRTDHAQLQPKPARHIPIWLGTFGDRALNVTGQLADGWIPSLEDAPPDRIEAMRDRVLTAARASGRDPEDISCVYNVEVRIDERPPEPRAFVVTGSPDAVADQLLGYVAMGFEAFNCVIAGPDESAQIERLAAEVIPLVRAAS
jgi:alkanesulfonate monooxygenase SsuD/methylene tetrahydromethanopterin reductase-like flavin-dependent oxidoreductase (luciferase family)